MLRQDQEFGLEVVDPAKDPLAAGPLARSNTRNSKLDKARVYFSVYWANHFMGMHVLFAAVRGERWYWGLGDPSPGAVIVTGLYLLTALTCLIAGTRRHFVKKFEVTDEASAGSPAWFWLGLAFVCLCLGINKQADFQSLLTLYGRDILRRADLYDLRREIQVVFILLVTGTACVSVLTVLWYVRRWRWACRIATIGLGVQAAFIVIRAASFHHVDRLLGVQLSAFAGVKLNLLLESSGLCIMLAAALSALPRRSV